MRFFRLAGARSTGDTLASPSSLRLVKLKHTLVGAFFVTCILTIPVLAGRDRFDGVAVLTGLVFGPLFVAVLILFLLRWLN
jgi:hypothetical protein